MRGLLSSYYWVIGLGYFGPILLILFVRSFFQTPEKYDPWLRRRTKTLFKLLNSEPRLEYAEELPLGEPLIFMANHSSLIDIPLLKAIIPSYFVGIIAEDQLNYFLYGAVVRRIGSIPIQRDNIRSSLKSFNLAKRKLQEGIQIAVLPEGSRSLNGQLIPFKRLAFRFAKESGAHIVPISFSGVFNMKNKDSFHLKPGSIIVRFGRVIRAETIQAMELDEIITMTYHAISDGLEPFEAGEQINQ